MDEGRVEAEKGMRTKKEQAQFDLAISTLTKDLALEKAMRRTAKVPRDVPPPDSGLSKGWDFNATLASYSNPHIYQACSSPSSHGDGWENTRSQNSRHLFSTELLAAKAMRHDLGEQCAAKLAYAEALVSRLEAVEAKAVRLCATCGSVKARHSAGGLCMDVEYAGGQSWSDPE